MPAVRALTHKGSVAARKGSAAPIGTVLPMWERRLRASMSSMHTLLSQPFTAAQSNAVVRAGLLRRLRAGK
jgi:hypothetical protein